MGKQQGLLLVTELPQVMFNNFIYLQPRLYDKGQNLSQINCFVVLVLEQMTSSNTGLIEISDGAQSLPQRQKETVGIFNPATFNSLGKGRCPAKQVNKTHLRVLPMALSAAATPGAHGQPSSPRGAGVADREPC